jgi:hypothetical protein
MKVVYKTQCPIGRTVQSNKVRRRAFANVGTDTRKSKATSIGAPEQIAASLLESNKHIIGIYPIIEATPHCPRCRRIDHLQKPSSTGNGHAGLKSQSQRRLAQ